MFSLREARFFICTIAVLLIYKSDGVALLMNVAAVNALLNLFSGQHLCVTGSCAVDKPLSTVPYLPFKLHISTDPVALFHYATTVIGVGFFVYGAIRVWG